MTMGAQVMGVELAKTLVTIWMNSTYTPGGRSETKIQRIYEYARKHHKQEPASIPYSGSTRRRS
jgi:ribose 5-phosphate isomerase RpiB